MPFVIYLISHKSEKMGINIRNKTKYILPYQYKQPYYYQMTDYSMNLKLQNKDNY